MKAFDKPTRVWVNAPSTHQIYHKFHGVCGIAFTDDKGETTLYFTEGAISNIIFSDTNCLETKNSQNNNLKH